MNSNLALLLVTVIVAIQANFVKTATTQYQLNGRNRATVTTVSQRCCNGQTTEVTSAVQAVLYDKSTRRTDFSSSRFTTRMDLLNKQSGDEKGHILASVFGGPAEIWNLAPQANNVNKRILKKNSILVGWYECEKWIQRRLERGTNLPITVDIRLQYSSGSCRPTHWSISAQNANGSDGCQSGSISNGFGGPFAASSCKRTPPRGKGKTRRMG